MKALSIHPEFATAIIEGTKTIEYRTWSTDYRGDILICSTAKKSEGYISGHALGVVTLVKIVEPKRDWRRPYAATSDTLEWMLENPRPIVPFPVKGKLSLWNCDHELTYAPAFSSKEEREEWFRTYWDPLITG